MSNKIIWSKKIDDQRIASVDVNDESIKISFEDDKELVFSTYHDQDCCEHVYGDFSVLKYHVEEMLGTLVRGIEVKAIKEMGFLLCIDCGYEEFIKMFVPCYNYQNGYYSDDLKLQIKDGELSVEVDITDCVEDHID